MTPEVKLALEVLNAPGASWETRAAASAIVEAALAPSPGLTPDPPLGPPLSMVVEHRPDGGIEIATSHTGGVTYRRSLGAMEVSILRDELTPPVRSSTRGVGAPPSPPETSGALLARLGTDAQKWAAEFEHMAARNGMHVTMADLPAWFANAIAVGEDNGAARERERAARDLAEFSSLGAEKADAIAARMHERFANIVAQETLGEVAIGDNTNWRRIFRAIAEELARR